MSDYYTDKIMEVEHRDGWGFQIKPSPIAPDWVSVATKGGESEEYDLEGMCIPPAMARDIAKALNEMADFCETQKD